MRQRPKDGKEYSQYIRMDTPTAITGDKEAFVGFAGFGGFSLALREADFDVIEIELNPLIAEVNRVNGGNVITGDFLDIDPADYVGYWLAQFSPPCTRISIANAKGSEAEIDLMLARKMCEFIRVARPRYFVLENVTQYQQSLSWLNIWYTLRECGYGVDAWNLNTADYGVPQSRRRMIVIARRDGRQPAKPWQTHSKNGDMFTRPWMNWYDAVEDLISGLDRSEFANWQNKWLPEKYRSFIIGNGSRSRPKLANQPADTITANHNQLRLKAFIVDGANSRGYGRTGPTVRHADQPMFTVTASALEKNSPPKAFVIGGQYQTLNNGRPRTVQNKDASEPIWTIVASENFDTRAYLAEGGGCTVVMNIRALARFQGFPDWFRFPDDRRLVCRGIGNALPPPLGAAIIRSLA